MFGKHTKTTEIGAFMEAKNQVLLSASDPEDLRWGQSGVRIFGQNEVIVENGLSKNNYKNGVSKQVDFLMISKQNGIQAGD